VPKTFAAVPIVPVKTRDRFFHSYDDIRMDVCQYHKMAPAR